MAQSVGLEVELTGLAWRKSITRSIEPKHFHKDTLIGQQQNKWEHTPGHQLVHAGSQP